MSPWKELFWIVHSFTPTTPGVLLRSPLRSFGEIYAVARNQGRTAWTTGQGRVVQRDGAIPRTRRGTPEVLNYAGA